MIRVAACIALSLSLSGCFFVYIPGGAIDKISDGLSGSEGQHCVPETAKIGDRMRLADGSTGTVQSLSGTSSRCKTADKPIRAKIEKGTT